MADITNPVIWKYYISARGSIIGIPVAGRILCVQEQDHQIQMWVRVYPEREKEVRTFVVHGTGNTIDLESTHREDYIGSVQIGPFVWHIFERTEIGT